MNRERALQFAVIVLLLIAGMLVGWHFSITPADTPTTAAGNAFREGFWEQRGLDLLVQVTLIFVGALGVAAVLPKHGEPHPTAVPDKGAGTFIKAGRDKEE
jgi:multisubunit Na+/H+ antiporter MnhB subunit